VHARVLNRESTDGKRWRRGPVRIVVSSMSFTEIRGTEQNTALRERVRELMAATFLMDVTELPDDVSQETCGRWTSLYHMTLLVAIEEEFGVSLAMAEMTAMTSLAKIVAILERYGVAA
jgi:acyl carrier protein